MRIVDLLNKESIMLNAAPKNKSEAIDMLIELQVKGGKIADKEATKKVFLQGKKSALPLLARALRFLMPKVRL